MAAGNPLGPSSPAGESHNLATEAAIRNVGNRLRALRTARRLTLRELARRTGVSMSMLSMVERGQTAPSIGTLVAVAANLGVPMADLFVSAHQAPADPVRRRHDQLEIESGNGVRRRLVHEDDARGLELVINEYAPHSSSAPVATHHEGIEFGVLLEGRLVVELDGRRHRLEVGDSIAYSSTYPHRFANPFPERAVAAWVNVNVPPSST